MHTIEKTEYEELWRYHNFQRNIINEGWLPSGVTLSSVEIVVEDASGATCTSTMVSGATVFSDTKVQYLLKGGESGQTYTVFIKVVASDGQKFEDDLEVTVK